MERVHHTGWKVSRRETLGLAVGALLACTRATPGAVAGQHAEAPMTTPATTRMPVVFVGHGSPMNAVEDNLWSQGFQALGRMLPKPRTILAVSAHWYTNGTFLSGNERPNTIHDFGGFSQELFDMQYPAPGDTALAARVVKLLGEERASVRLDWGLDHGTWTVLHHMVPKADIPVVQLSLDAGMAPAGHLQLGEKLRQLREEGVLVLASGNITHNLRHAFGSMQSGNTTTPSWAANFDRDVGHALLNHDGAFLAKVVGTDEGRMSHPTVDHYLPLLYAAGASTKDDAVTFPITGFDAASLSMRSVVLG